MDEPGASVPTGNDEYPNEGGSQPGQVDDNDAACETCNSRDDTTNHLRDGENISSLCQLCWGFQDRPTTKVEMTYDQIRGRSILGCHLCALIVSEIDKASAQEYFVATEELPFQLDITSEYNRMDITVMLHDLHGASKRFWLHLRPEGDRHEWRIFHTDVDTSLNFRGDSTASDQSMTLAKLWLNECLTHKECNIDISEEIPTRLLDVGDATSPKIRLRVCSEDVLPTSMKYLSLSHCWGKSPMHKLKLENMAAMRVNINMWELPKTFRDAIEVTRRLGFRFLWIDSLCIVQDSAEDWAKESARMDKVYMNSCCNICATASVDGSGGLSRERDPLGVRQVRLRGRNPSVSNLLIVYNQYCFEWDVRGAPLNRRAWVVQERVLSRRNLHFTHGQLYWECCTGAANEMFPDGLPKNVFAKNEKSEIASALANNTRADNDADGVSLADRWHRNWAELVQTYCRTSLTFRKDRLAAIAGLASRFSTAVSSAFANKQGERIYLAGLWSHNLASQLLWVFPDTRPTIGRTQDQSCYVAPSWSWASGDSHLYDVYIEPKNFNLHLISILSASTTLTYPQNLYGPVTDGKLIVRGKLGIYQYRGIEKLRVRGAGLQLRSLSPKLRTISPDSRFHLDFHEDDESDYLSEGAFMYLLPMRVCSSSWKPSPDEISDVKAIANFFRSATRSGQRGEDAQSHHQEPEEESDTKYEDRGPSKRDPQRELIKGLILIPADPASPLTGSYALDNWKIPTVFRRIGVFDTNWDWNSEEGSSELETYLRFCDQFIAEQSPAMVGDLGGSDDATSRNSTYEIKII